MPYMSDTSFRVQVIFKVVGWRCFNIKVMFSNLWVLLVSVSYKKKHLKNHWVWLLYPLFKMFLANFRMPTKKILSEKHQRIFVVGFG